MKRDGEFLRLDPRIETSGLWPDFHAHFVTALSDWLRRGLGPSYVALVEERVYVAWEGTPVSSSLYRPDISVAAVSPRSSEPSAAAGGTAVATRPIIVPVAVRDEVRERFVSIRTAQ
ncbi:MAG: DUF4058 family protein, partial [Bacillota bacterium]